MKIAIISDIHGNMQALQEVLADINNENCDKIFCLGDIAMAGPEPVKTIEMIKSMYDSDKIELIQGNTDELISDFNQEYFDKVSANFPIMAGALLDDVKLIPGELKDFLKNLPKQKSLDLEGVKILLVHGSPRANDENIMPNLPISEIEEIISATEDDVIFCGHTHIPCGYQTAKNQTVVNVGSVGRPFTENPQACYAIAEINSGEINIMHKFLDYKREKAAEILEKRGFEGAEKLATILIAPKTRHL